MAEAVRHRREVVDGLSPASALTGTEHGHEVAQGFSPANVVVGIFNPAWTPRMALAAAVAPTVVSLAYEWTTGVRPSNAIRAAAGAPIGLVVAWLVVAATDNQVN